MKTYSVTIKTLEGNWITNWYEYINFGDIDWNKVEDFCKRNGCLAYGFYFGNNSKDLASSNNRTVIKEIMKS